MAQKNKENCDCDDCNKCSEGIDKVKEKYEVLRKKYSLPEFKELHEEFDIEKSDFGEDTILRDIRKTMAAKYFALLTFIENQLNPSSMFQMMLTKCLEQEDRTKLNELFDKIGLTEIESFKLDIKYEEKKEAEFIIDKFKEWNEIKPSIEKIIDSMKTNWKKVSTKKEKSYFG
ncbi:MAG: hypothetical protein WC781_01775 [Candidatus Pacearchaeota archaeon]|jgi:hypothetical protein